ncbi:MAG: NAD-dependent epimerase/dehydratase family protein [Bacteroidia bacterium]|nr:NAD-dependent epimerase/dehydratase family protein [Bacteroidia bacterium]
MTTALVTGASGFVGRRVVDVLLAAGVHVRAGVRHHGSEKALPRRDDCEVVAIDICDARSLAGAMRGVDQLYHFAATVTSHTSAAKLLRVNAEGTRSVWEAAADAGIGKALYCSSTAVYGLLAQNGQAVTEDILPRAVEPYGRSKLLGERIAAEIGAGREIDTVVIRPTAVFGPGEHTHFGSELRKAAVSRILLGGGFRNKHFNFVHVDDVAAAAVHVMQLQKLSARVYNIVAEPSVSYEHAFQAYLRALDGAGYRFLRQRLLGQISVLIERRPSLARRLRLHGRRSLAFGVWRPGFDMTFSSARLRETDFQFRWTDFEVVLRSCLDD